MSVKYYRDSDGNFLGAFEGADPPAGAIETDTLPQNGKQKYVNGAWQEYYIDDALMALASVDGVATRCLIAGVAFPAEWQAYVVALREIVRGSAGPLPEMPSYPEGT